MLEKWSKREIHKDTNQWFDSTSSCKQRRILTLK